jgi:dephospho-CoA kinase
MKSRKVIAILGLPGSGKSEVINFIIEKYGWPKIYCGEPTFDELRRLKLPFTEKNERMVREGLRKKFGARYYGEQVIKKIKKISGDKNIVLESFYTWDEYLLFKDKFKNNFVTLAVHASSETRYGRLKNRKERALTEKEARGRDHAQIENLKQGGPISMADHMVVNEGTKNDLRKNLGKIINKLKK